MTVAMIRPSQTILSLFVGALIVLSAVVARGEEAASGADDKAKMFVESLAENAILSLADPSLERAERVRRFRTILNDNFAVSAIGRWVLGKYWRRASDAEKREYLALFEELIVATYVDRFAEYSGTGVVVGEVRSISRDDFLVRSRLDQGGGQASVNVDWRLRLFNGVGYRISDMMVEGLSMAQTQRSEFYSVISREGRTVEGLLRVLRERVKTLNNPSSATNQS